jgi:L-cysteine S-thiosulfotransferase
LERGKAAFYRRQGQVHLACANCHEQNPGKRLAGNVIPQAHPTGYPLYRLEWQAVGSLQRRLRTCLAGIRAETPPYGAPDLVELELYLMWRANGMRLETPSLTKVSYCLISPRALICSQCRKLATVEQARGAL